MKTKTHITALTALIATLTLVGCAGPDVRHDTRVDRREDAAEHTETRVTNRQDNRYDRRGDRQERIDSRY